MESLIIGREKEKHALARIYASSESEFVAVCGRRRVGKTYLIREYFDGLLTFSASGQANQPLKKQIRAFCESFPADAKPRKQPRDWFEVFHCLALYLETQPAKRKVVFLDELPWFDTAKSDFVSSLEYFWNSWASARHDIVLIVCGSATSWMMNKLINNHGGLHNRLTNRIFLMPFNLQETKVYLQSRSFNLSDYEIAVTYMIMGGIPFYLKMLNPELSLSANIDELLFSQTGYLRYEMDNLYSALFRNSSDYFHVVKVLSTRRIGMSRSEIVEGIGKKTGGNLTVVLTNLESCGFIRKYVCHNNGRRSTLYQLIDFFTIFYFRFLYEKTITDDIHWSVMQALPAVQSWYGMSFELLCLLHTRQIKQKLGISGVITTEYAWLSAEEGAQVDLIISRQDRTANICEIKFSMDEYTIDNEEEMKLRHRLAAVRSIPDLRTKSLMMTFITSLGLRHNAHSGIVQNEITLADLFA